MRIAKYLSFLLLVVIAAAACNASEPTPVYGFQVINRYPHDPAAFTQGLLFHKQRLYESTGIYGQSSLREVDLISGKVQKAVKLPNNVFGEGLAVWQDQLIQLTWREGVAFVFDLTSMRLNKQFEYDTEGWGLTNNNEHLIMSDGSAKLYFRDPKTFAVIKTLDVLDQGSAVKNLNELEFVNGDIYANVWLSNRIARISPITGQVLAWIDLTGLHQFTHKNDNNQDNVLNGIAYDTANDRLFVTGKRWSVMYEIKVIDEQNKPMR